MFAVLKFRTTDHEGKFWNWFNASEKRRRTNERVAFKATMFIGTFGPLVWEKFLLANYMCENLLTIIIIHCCFYPLLDKLCALNFHGCRQLRKYFNNKKFPIYGIWWTDVCRHGLQSAAHACQTHLWKSGSQYTLLAKSVAKGMPSSPIPHTEHLKHTGW